LCFDQLVPIRKSSAASIDALAADLASDRPATREAAVARLTVIGPRAVESLVALVGEPEKGPLARQAALRALEALADERSLEAALKAALDADAGVAAAAIGAARVFLKGRRGSDVLDRLTAIALDRGRPDAVRLAAMASLEELKPSTLEPLWQALAADPSLDIRDRAASSQRGESPAPSAADQLVAAAENALPDDPETLRQALGAGAAEAPLPALYRLIERLREREAAVPAAVRGEWLRTRGTAHVALARRASRLGLYDLRESLERANGPLPVEFLTALSLAGDASCLDAIAFAYGHASDGLWRRHLGETFQTIVAREGLTRRHAVLKRIEKRWGAIP
jgi:hypothetical protein